MDNKELKELIERLDNKLSVVYDNQRHLSEASNGVFASAVRANVDIREFLDAIEDGSAFKFAEFFLAEAGNLLNFVDPKYHSMIQPLVDITAGGNGGMASIGRGEFAISFLSNFQSVITKSGRGDLENNGKFEEVKHNGGKLAIENKAGNEIFRTFKALMERQKFQLKKKDYLPLRKGDAKLYTMEEKNQLNGLYWEAMTGEKALPMSDSEWRAKSLSRAFNHLFEKVNSLLVMNKDNDFVRFFDADSALKFYSDRANDVEFELRANQANAPSFYLGRGEVVCNNTFNEVFS